MSVEETENVYRPIFPDIIVSLRAYIESKIKDFKFGTSNSVTELPYLIIESVESQMMSPDDAFLVRHGVIHRGNISLKVYTSHEDINKYYDIIINLLHGWGADSGFVDLRVDRKALYPIREEMDCYVIAINVVITYQDFLADTTFPLVSEANCTPCIDTIGMPQSLRVEKVEVIPETHV